MEVLTKILQQGTEFDTLAETVLADRFERLVELVTMMGDQGELPIAMALANVVPGSQWVRTSSKMTSVSSSETCPFDVAKLKSNRRGAGTPLAFAVFPGRARQGPGDAVRLPTSALPAAVEHVLQRS